MHKHDLSSPSRPKTAYSCLMRIPLQRNAYYFIKVPKLQSPGRVSGMLFDAVHPDVDRSKKAAYHQRVDHFGLAFDRENGLRRV